MGGRLASECSLTVLTLDACYVGNLLGIKQSCYSGKQALSKRSMTGDNVAKSTLLDVLDKQRGPVLRETLDLVSPIEVLPSHT
jgi:hypothetical protein